MIRYLVGALLVLALIAGGLHYLQQRAKWIGIADERAELVAIERARVDSIGAIADSARIRVDTIEREAAERVARAERQAEVAEQEADSALDVAREASARLNDAVPDSTRELVREVTDSYEAALAQKDSVIAAKDEVIAAERLRTSSLQTALAAMVDERDAYARTVTAQEREIEALRNALDTPSFLPSGLTGQVLAFTGGLVLGAVAGG